MALRLFCYACNTAELLSMYALIFLRRCTLFVRTHEILSASVTRYY